MVRVFVTGDNHIGLKYMKYRTRESLSKIRIDTFSGMVEKANLEGCSLFVITGDLFENTYGISKQDVRRVLTILSEFHGTVVIIPGNHDYYDKDTRLYKYLSTSLSDFDNVLYVCEEKPIELKLEENTVILYPSICKSLHSERGENGLSWIKSEGICADSFVRIGIAHGSLEGESLDSEGVYYPMTRDELSKIPVDLWLLGHTHVPFPKISECDKYVKSDNVLNPGTHSQTDVSNLTSGECIIAEIRDGDGVKDVYVKRFISGGIGFYRVSVNVNASLKESLDDGLKHIPDGSVVELELFGGVGDEEYRERDAIISEALSRFSEYKYSDEGLCRIISKKLLDSQYPETSFAYGFLDSLLARPDCAQLAYELLEELSEVEK